MPLRPTRVRTFGTEREVRDSCRLWHMGLHSFRMSFATMLRNLAIVELRSERTLKQVNASYAALSAGGPAESRRL